MQKKFSKSVLALMTSLLINSAFAMEDYSFAANPSNRVDETGKKHNFIMTAACVMNRQAILQREGFITVMKESYLQLGMERLAGDVELNLEFIKKQSQVMAAINDASKTQNVLYELGFNSKTGAGYLASLIKSSDKLLLKGYKYSQFKAEVVAIEAKVNADVSISKAEKEVILHATSVARFSAGFWYSHPEALNPLFPTTPNIGTAERKLTTATKVDIAGAIVGGLVGASAGGVGAGPGALAGAAQASATQCIVDFLDKWF